MSQPELSLIAASTVILTVTILNLGIRAFVSTGSRSGDWNLRSASDTADIGTTILAGIFGVISVLLIDDKTGIFVPIILGVIASVTAFAATVAISRRRSAASTTQVKLNDYTYEIDLTSIPPEFRDRVRESITHAKRLP